MPCAARVLAAGLMVWLGTVPTGATETIKIGLSIRLRATRRAPASRRRPRWNSPRRSSMARILSLRTYRLPMRRACLISVAPRSNRPSMSQNQTLRLITQQKVVAMPEKVAASGKPGPHDLRGCGDNLVWSPSAMAIALAAAVRKVPSARDPATALAKPDRNKAIALARGAESDLVAVF
jgi:hypothetical protein